MVEQIGTNYIINKKEPAVIRPLSYVLNLPYKLAFLSTKIGRHPSEETIDSARHYIRSSCLEDITLRAGHTSILQDAKRLFTDDRLKDISLVGRSTLGVLAVAQGGIMGKLFRADHYNPFTKTIHLYSDVDAIANHELGHATDYANKKHTTLYSLASIAFPPLILYKEFMASKHAHQYARPQHRDQTARYLIPAYSTYVSGFLGLATLPIAMATSLAGIVVNQAAKLFRSRRPIRDVVPIHTH